MRLKKTVTVKFAGHYGSGTSSPRFRYTHSPR
jgi:hypothetical protein